MKKVISINFSGRLINIEEDAYTSLQSYMDSLKQYFSKEEGSEEIISDIENRISEIFSDKQKTGSAITTDDVNEVKNKIGSPEDFESLDEENGTTSNTSNTKNTTGTEQKQFVKREKLYRDETDKMVGGVASGLASYFNLDTVLVRIIFIVLLFSGVGFLLYIILWAFVPGKRNLKPSVERRLYRNTEDKFIGGVASGLANYFGIDVWIPRLIFAAPFLFAILGNMSHMVFDGWFDGRSFFRTSLGGTTTIVYFILLWLVPEAKTREEKMAMRGEKLDLESLKNNVTEGIKNFGDKANKWAEELNEKSGEFSKKANEFGAAASKQANNIAKQAGPTIGSGIGLVIKGIALFIGGIIAFSLLMAGISFLFGLGAFWPVKEYIIQGPWQTTWLWGSIIFCLIPCIAFIIWLVRRIFKIKTNIKPLKIGLTTAGIAGLFCAVALAASLAKSIRNDNDNVFPTEIVMAQPQSTLLVTATQPEVIYSGSLPWVDFNNDESGFDITADTLKYNNVKLIIEKSPDSAYHTILKKFSRGLSQSDAERRAQQIQYDIKTVDGVVDLGSHIRVAKKDGFRIQQVQVTVQVPVGRKIKFDGTVDKLHSYGVRIKENWGGNSRRNRYRRYESYTNHFDYDINVDYLMTSEGKLRTQLELDEEKLEKEKEAIRKRKEEQDENEDEERNRTTTNEDNKSNTDNNANKAAKDATEQEKKERKQKEIEENNRKIEELRKKNEEIKTKEITSITTNETTFALSTKNSIGFVPLLY